MIRWQHTHTTDTTGEYGTGIRPLIRTDHPDGVTAISELPRAKRAARAAYARYYGVPLRTVSASPVYTHGRASVAYVVAYVPGQTTAQWVNVALSTTHPEYRATHNPAADYDGVTLEAGPNDPFGAVQHDPQTGMWDAEHNTPDGEFYGSLSFPTLAEALEFVVTGKATPRDVAASFDGAVVEVSGDVTIPIGDDRRHVTVTDDRPGWYFNEYNSEHEMTREGEVHGSIEELRVFVREAQRRAGLTPTA
jgi:hypothetical protein